MQQQGGADVTQVQLFGAKEIEDGGEDGGVAVDEDLWGGMWGVRGSSGGGWRGLGEDLGGVGGRDRGKIWGVGLEGVGGLRERFRGGGGIWIWGAGGHHGGVWGGDLGVLGEIWGCRGEEWGDLGSGIRGG